MLNLYSMFLFLPVLFFTVAGFYGLIQRANRRTRLLFFATCMGVAGWFMLEALIYSSNTPEQAILFSRLTYTVSSLMLATLVHFSFVFLGRAGRYWYIIGLGYIFGGFSSLSALLSPHFLDGVKHFYWGYFPQLGPLGYGHVVLGATCIALVVNVFYRELEWATNTERQRVVIKSSLLAYAISSLTLIHHLPAMGYEVHPLGFLPTMGFVAVFGIAIHEHGLRQIVPRTAADAVTSSIGEPVVACDDAGRVTFANSVFKTLVDCSPVIGRSIDKLLPKKLPDAADESSELTLNDRHFEVTAHDLESASGMLYVFHDVTRQIELQNELEESATHDELTDLPNRRGLSQWFEQQEGELTIFFVDIDKLKSVNETLGHEFGDKLIGEAARRLQSTPGVHYTARIGGDEFVLVVDESNILKAKEAIKEQFDETPFCLDNNTIYSSASVGVHTGRPDDDDFLNRGSRAMKKAKNEPGTAFAESTSETITTGLKIGSRLRKGIEDGEILPHYQPVVDVTSGDIRRYEALVRWEHPDRGLLTPGDFLQEAEEYGVITRLDHQVLQCVLSDIENGAIDRPVHVNLSPHHFIQKDPDELLSVFDREPDEQLVVEVTETNLVTHEDNARSILTALEQRGASIALDDFGTGYSSISHLKEWPTDVLKIDRSLTRPLPEEGRQFLHSLTLFARNLGQTVIVEGVETNEQHACLDRLGIRFAQGYYLARPAPLDELPTSPVV